MQADTLTRQPATMGHMRWGNEGAVNAQTNPRPAANEAAGDSAAEFHFCCICGALLAVDLEDEINGEGWGRDICGDCNRTKNFETMMGNE
jgi:hypothetical protein